MKETRKGEDIVFGVIGCFETGRLPVRSWRSRSQRHCCCGAGFDRGLARLVLGGRRHRGVCRLRNSFGGFVFDHWAPEARLKERVWDFVPIQAKM